MAIPSRTRLQRYFAELQKIEEHRSLDAEKKIQKLYKEMLTNLQGFIGVGYAKYAEDDKLTYATLAKKGEYARFLEEVQAKVNYIAPQVNKAITEAVKDVYKLAYEGMVNAVAKSVNDKDLEKLLSGIHLTPAQVIKAAVNNPVNKLTLSKTLEKNRKEIVYNIKQTVTVGIMNGDSMPTMAKKIQNDVDQNYRKAMLITRTEVHRVRETGHNDSAQALDHKLAEADYKYRMCKEWRSKQDRVTRHTRLANHVKMHGKIVLQDEDFDLGNGVTAPCPGQSGKAYHDCNCRCRISRDLLSDAEFFEKTGRHFPKVEKPKEPEKKPVEKPVEKVENKPKATKPKAAAKPKAAPKKPAPSGGLSTSTFPDTFNQKTAKKQTQKFVDYINSVENADTDMVSIYNSIGKMESIESNGIPFKLSYTKSNHAVGARMTYSGRLVEASLKIPKLDGDNIAGSAQTTAHELGHYIDLLLRKDANQYGNWISTSKNVETAIEKSRTGMSDKVSELFKTTNAKISEIRKTVTDRYRAKIDKFKEDNAEIVKSWLNDITSYKKYEKGLKALYAECEDVVDYETRNQMNGINGLQDIYDALSKGKYRDTGVVKYGHGSKYYRREESQVHEIWANYCSLSLTRPDLIDLLREDKPELVAALEEVKAEILKRIGEM